MPIWGCILEALLSSFLLVNLFFSIFAVLLEVVAQIPHKHPEVSGSQEALEQPLGNNRQQCDGSAALAPKPFWGWGLIYLNFSLPAPD